MNECGDDMVKEKRKRHFHKNLMSTLLSGERERTNEMKKKEATTTTKFIVLILSTANLLLLLTKCLIAFERSIPVNVD